MDGCSRNVDTFLKENEMRKTGLALTAVLPAAGLSGVAMADVIHASDTTYADPWSTPDTPNGSLATMGLLTLGGVLTLLRRRA